MPASDATAHAGAVAPEAFRLTICTGDSGVDLATVTAVSVKLLPRNGATKTWAMSIESQTADTMVAVREFSAGDIPKQEIYTVTTSLTVPGGVRRCDSVRLIVTA